MGIIFKNTTIRAKASSMSHESNVRDYYIMSKR